MKKWISLVLALCLGGSLLPGAWAEEPPVRLGALTGPTAMGMVKLLEDGEDAYAPTLLGSADELVPLILQGQVDIAAVPANLAATLYAKTQGGVEALAVNVLGVLYLCEYNTDSLGALADLRGKTVCAAGKGSTPEYFLRYVLTQNGIDPDKDVALEWKSEPGEVVAVLSAAGEGIALLPQPYVAAAEETLGEGFRAAVSLSEEWAALDNGTLCTTAVVVARSEFLRERPQAVEAFLRELASSVQWVNENVEEAARLCGGYGIIRTQAAERAIPKCNLVCITGEEMKQALSGCLEVIYEQNPKAVGGAMPGDDFYYGAE